MAIAAEKPRYRGACFCGVVAFTAADPVGAVICHCTVCQTLHGAPMQWAAIFAKSDFEFAASSREYLAYFHTEHGPGRTLPCRVTCARCHTRVGDEGRTMFFSFPSLFDFGQPRQIPASFRPTCHLFYRTRLIDIHDELPKYTGKRGTPLWTPSSP